MARRGASQARPTGRATRAQACGLGLATLLGGLAHGQDAASAPDVPTLARVVVTGTHIPQTDIEGALPVQVIRREEIERSGVTTVEQLLERVPANVNPFNAAATVGDPSRPGLSGANLRGLGGGSTLVLLNGRRLANYAFDSESVDLNSIPLAAIDRVEVLKDGASAIYGTDAIAGVINFILRRDYAGLEFSADLAATQHGGGNSGFVTATLGTGDPARDGYNVFATLSYQKDQALMGRDRDFASTSYRPDLGRDRMSIITFPANIVDRPGRRLLNPSRDSGCDPPTSIPFQGPPFPDSAACGFDYAPLTNLLPEVERASALLRGTWRADAAVDVFAEALIGRNRFDTELAPLAIDDRGTAFGAPVYPAGGPYYPSAFAAANGLSGDLHFSYRGTELGPRLNSTTTDMQRYVVGALGQAAGWDFDIAAVFSVNNQGLWYGGSYAYLSKLMPALNSGLINPWGPSSPEGNALLASTLYSGTPQTANATTTLVNAYASRNIAQLPAGPLALALGAEVRRERLSYDYDPAILTGDSPIGDGLQSISGSRGALAVFAELNVPVAPGLDAQLAARFDDYSDFGSTTNPKVALRWQPAREVLVRGSWGTGFRAPPLYTLNEPPRTERLGGKDPIRCPVTGKPEDCELNVPVTLGGNPNLRPETSTQWNLGLVLEPAQGLSFGLDYWNIVQDGIIVPLDVENALRFESKFADRIVRGPVDPNFPNLPGPIVAIDGTPINLGTTRTSGIDVFLNWALPAQDWGRLRVGLQGTYVRQWETQIDGENYFSTVGNAVYGAPVPRWRSTLTFDWTRGPWGATLSQVYSTGYVETRPVDGELRQVGAAQTWDLQGRYSGFDGWQLAAGIRNLFDAEPPASNTGLGFQVGYNPLAASPLGRVFYLRATYSFH